jgi:hypothetical protein
MKTFAYSAVMIVVAILDKRRTVLNCGVKIGREIECDVN